MKRYCVFIRGINVNGRKLAMHELKIALEKIKMEKVMTILATGNIILDASEEKKKLLPFLENYLTDYFNMELQLFIYTISEMKNILVSNPFAKDETQQNYVILCRKEWLPEVAAIFLAKDSFQGESLQIVNNHCFWTVPKRYTTKTFFAKQLTRKIYVTNYTMRNLNTIEKVLLKAINKKDH